LEHELSDERSLCVAVTNVAVSPPRQVAWPGPLLWATEKGRQSLRGKGGQFVHFWTTACPEWEAAQGSPYASCARIAIAEALLTGIEGASSRPGRKIVLTKGRA
jgi:hypothetical protein